MKEPAMQRLDHLLRRAIKRGRLTVTNHDGQRYDYGSPNLAPISVRLTHPRAAAHIVRYPQLGTGEAFMWGWLEIEPPHDIRDLVLFVAAEVRRLDRRAVLPRGLTRLAAQLAATLDGLNPRTKARKSAEHTYNLDRRLYELFLDEDRQYTMGYYRSLSNSLEQAQLDKKAHLAAKLYMQPAWARDRPLQVLDIGCGWGGLALYLNQHYGAEVLGVSLAPDQIAFCRERAAAAGVEDQVRFALMDYRDVAGTFDRICSVGLLEHVGKPHYRAFYQHTAELLAPDGVMLSHCCGRAAGPGFTDAWTRKYIFPGGYIPALSELVTQSERAGWQVTDVEAMRFHYAHTLAEWYRRTVQHQRAIVDLYDETFYRMWLFYLCGAEQAFYNNDIINWQIQYVKDRAALPMTRDYMHTESQRLREHEAPPTWHLGQAA
jgi:cyclopropane-fatty-acyl-phospholipid synthase